MVSQPARPGSELDPRWSNQSDMGIICPGGVVMQ